MDYYDILELNRDCSQDDIRTSYRRLCKLYHPDKHPGYEEMFNRVKLAYDTLSDVNKRRRYDYGDEGDEYNNPSRQDITHIMCLDLYDLYYGCKKEIKIGDDNYVVNVEPCSLPNSKIVYKGLGWNGGDFVITLIPIDGSNIWLDGELNIHIKHKLNWIDAILGGEFSVKLFDDIVFFNVSEYSKKGDKISLDGFGYPRCGVRKKLIIELDIEMPNHLSDEQKDMLKRIKEMG